jgi:hypothetical protein
MPECSGKDKSSGVLFSSGAAGFLQVLCPPSSTSMERTEQSIPAILNDGVIRAMWDSSRRNLWAREGMTLIDIF